MNELTDKELGKLQSGDGSETTSEDCRRAAMESAKRAWLKNGPKNGTASVNFEKMFGLA